MFNFRPIIFLIGKILTQSLCPLDKQQKAHKVMTKRQQMGELT